MSLRKMHKSQTSHACTQTVLCKHFRLDTKSSLRTVLCTSRWKSCFTTPAGLVAWQVNTPASGTCAPTTSSRFSSGERLMRGYGQSNSGTWCKLSLYYCIICLVDLVEPCHYCLGAANHAMASQTAELEAEFDAGLNYYLSGAHTGVWPVK